MSDLKSKEFKTSIDYTHHDSTTRKGCTLVLFDDDGNVIPNNITESPNDVIDSKSDAIESAEPSGCESCKWYEPDHLICYPEPSEQVTSKLKNPCDSLLTDDSAECKEQKSKLDLISRADAIEAVENNSYGMGSRASVKAIKALPSAEKPCKTCGYYNLECPKDCEYSRPLADRPQGEWINKDVVRNEDNPIDEWQECECSVCGKWHTTPYAYYFNNYNYCPNCGARMEATK